MPSFDRAPDHPESTVLAVVGVGVGVVWQLVGSLRMALVVRGARPVGPELRDEIDRVAEAMQAPAVPVRLSEAVQTPFVTGLLSPVLVCPTSLASRFDANEREFMWRHELTHVVRGDALWAAVGAWWRVLFPAHSAAGWLTRELAFAREEAVDATVPAEYRHSYAHLLLDLAQATRAEPAWQAAGMASSTLARRVEAMSHSRPPAVMGLGRLVAMSAVTAVDGATSTIVLKAGGGKVLTVVGLTKAALANPEVADIRSRPPDQLEVTAVGKGRTTMMLWNAKGERFEYVVLVE